MVKTHQIDSEILKIYIGKNMNQKTNEKICIYGLGYVGLPLAVALSSHYDVLGFDLNQKRIKELNSGTDVTKQSGHFDLKKAVSAGLRFTNNPDDTKTYDIYIVTVPTPIDTNNKPDLRPLIEASKTIGTYLNAGNIVIYESTVFPGATEEICAKYLEQSSGLTFNKDFFLGYSPERINPGDTVNTLATIPKITAGSTPEISEKVDQIYTKIIDAGTHKVKSIKIAEAAKVIENIQRDVNIALINEFSQICHHLKINTNDVLEAASTKWNFIKYTPGLVGGHCISVDPYYLIHKSKSFNYEPDLITNARRINNQMGKYVASRTIELMLSNGIKTQNAKILVLGFTFKENCPDIRNTKVIDVVKELQDQGMDVHVHDPLADHAEVLETYKIIMLKDYNIINYDAIIISVAHDEYKQVIKMKSNQIIFDVKSLTTTSDGTL